MTGPSSVDKSRACTHHEWVLIQGHAMKTQIMIVEWWMRVQKFVLSRPLYNALETSFRLLRCFVYPH